MKRVKEEKGGKGRGKMKKVGRGKDEKGGKGERCDVNCSKEKKEEKVSLTKVIKILKKNFKIQFSHLTVQEHERN
jgi:hypothetical protein